MVFEPKISVPALRRAPEGSAPVKVAERASKKWLGQRLTFEPIHVNPQANQDKPLVQPMLNLYAGDQRYADSAGDNGQGQVGGAAAMANALVYLRQGHKPAFPLVLQESLAPNSNLIDLVGQLFRLCQSRWDSGTTIMAMRDCAKLALEEGGYNTVNTFVRGMHSDLAQQRFAPGITDLKAMAQTRWQPGSHVGASDRAVVLLFGWYSLSWDQALGAFAYHREGGQYVTLAGHDAANASVYYVSNPLIDYQSLGLSRTAYSKITLEPVPDRPDLKAPAGMKGLWQTRDLVAGHLAVLEDMVIVLPWQ
jgi:hypothetical protein